MQAAAAKAYLGWSFAVHYYVDSIEAQEVQSQRHESPWPSEVFEIMAHTSILFKYTIKVVNPKVKDIWTMSIDVRGKMADKL